ncbi:MAG: hypothetical protein JW750_12255 [Anaerolineaceae bacterium]|nr:hypothetical protein [Anaerolineaceae bacterium]
MVKKEEVEEVVTQAESKGEELKEKITSVAKETGKSLYNGLRKVFLASVGAAVIAEEELVSLVDRLAERGEIAESDAKDLIKEIVDKREKAAKEKMEQIRASNPVKVATKTDIDALQKKIEEMTAKIDELKAASGKSAE